MIERPSSDALCHGVRLVGTGPDGSPAVVAEVDTLLLAREALLDGVSAEGLLVASGSLGADGFKLLGSLRRSRRLGVALAVRGDPADLLRRAAHQEIGILLPVDHVGDLEWQILMLQLSGLDTWGVRHWLREDGSVLGTVTLISESEIAPVARRIVEGMNVFLSQQRQLRLVLEELLSNAMHHAGPARTRVELAFALDRNHVVILVADEGGSLPVGRALRILDRHEHRRGTLDSRGRGLQLARLCSDRLFLQVEPGRRTEAVVLLRREGPVGGIKPVWLHRCRGGNRGRR